MAGAFAHRIKYAASIAVLTAVALAVTAADFGTTETTPGSRAATDRQRNEVARERLTCERWGAQEGSEKFTGCMADLTDIRVKHDRRGANDPGNRRDGLMTLF